MTQSYKMFETHIEMLAYPKFLSACPKCIVQLYTKNVANPNLENSF